MTPEEEKSIFTEEFIKRVVEQYPNHRMYWDDDEVEEFCNEYSRPSEEEEAEDKQVNGAKKKSTE